MKPIKTETLQVTESGGIDVEYYIRKAHKLRSETLEGQFGKLKNVLKKKTSQNADLPKAA